MKINIKAFYLSIITSLAIFLPSLMMILLGQSSFTIGVVITSCLIIFCKLFFSYKGTRIEQRDVRPVLIFSLAITFVLVHFILVFYFTEGILPEQDFSKFILSFLFLIICSCAAFIAKKTIENLSWYELQSTMKLVLYIVIFNAVVSLTKIDFFNTGLAKPTFFFQEPSHFALVCAPLIMYFSFININNWARIALLIGFGLWGVYIQNFTMLIAVILAYMVTARSMLPTFIFIAILAIPGYLFIESDFFIYYRNRLDLAGDTQNLSTLVLLQGWQNSFLTIEKSLLGAGYQQYGISTLYGGISNKIHQMLNIYINMYDGGSTAPKIIGEFGLFGIALIFAYLVGWLRIFLLGRRMRFSNDRKLLLFVSLYLTSFVELFIRGAGYFTPTMFFFIASVMYFLSRKNSN